MQQIFILGMLVGSMRGVGEVSRKMSKEVAERQFKLGRKSEAGWKQAKTGQPECGPPRYQI